MNQYIEALLANQLIKQMSRQNSHQNYDLLFQEVMFKHLSSSF